MTAVGERLPAARVWLAPGEEPVHLASLAATGPALLVFYLYDWSAT